MVMSLLVSEVAQFNEIKFAKVGEILMAPHPKSTLFSQIKIAPKQSITAPNYSRGTSFLCTRRKPLFEEVKPSNAFANTQNSKQRSIVRPHWLNVLAGS